MEGTAEGMDTEGEGMGAVLEHTCVRAHGEDTHIEMKMAS